jgi:hypothetical protein
MDITKEIIESLTLSCDTINILKQDIPNQPREEYYGNREYKLHLVMDKSKNSEKKIMKRSTQLKFRLNEGNGKALYLIGINDNGDIIGLDNIYLIESIKNLCKMTNYVNCKIKSINIYNINDPKHITYNKLDLFNLESLSNSNNHLKNKEHFSSNSKYIAAIRFYKERKDNKNSFNNLVNNNNSDFEDYSII